MNCLRLIGGDAVEACHRLCTTFTKSQWLRPLLFKEVLGNLEMAVTILEMWTPTNFQTLKKQTEVDLCRKYTRCISTLALLLCVLTTYVSSHWLHVQCSNLQDTRQLDHNSGSSVSWHINLNRNLYDPVLWERGAGPETHSVYFGCDYLDVLKHR